MTGIERQIAPILFKLGKRALNVSLEASSFNCAFISFLGLLTNNVLTVHFSLELCGYIRVYDGFLVC